MRAGFVRLLRYLQRQGVLAPEATKLEDHDEFAAMDPATFRAEVRETNLSVGGEGMTTLRKEVRGVGSW